MDATRVAEAVAAGVAKAKGGGVVRVDQAGTLLAEGAWGLAERRLGVPMTPWHRLGVASGSKGFTALVVMGLVAEGVLSLDTTLGSVLGADMPPLLDDGITVDHLLTHQSGIEDYLDDDADPGEYPMSVPLHKLVSPEEYLPMFAHCRQLEPPGGRCVYNNGAFILLSVLAQRAAGRPFHDLVAERVLGLAGMDRSGYFRSDDLPADAALGYVKVAGKWRSNVLHLPVVGGGDGGAYVTTADMARFWRALDAGEILPTPVVEQLLTPISTDDDDGWWYGRGLPVNPESGMVNLNGQDAGVSFTSTYWREPDIVYTVIGNTPNAAWKVVDAVRKGLGLD